MFSSQFRMQHNVVLAIVILLLISNLCACVPMQELTMAEQVERSQQVDVLLKQAVYQMRLGTSEGLRNAEAALLLAYDLRSEDSRVLDGLGCVSWRKGDLIRAEELFVKAANADSKNDRAFAHLALVAERRGDKDAAKALFKLALEVAPSNHRTRNNYAAFIFDNQSFSKKDAQFVQSELRKARFGAVKGSDIIEDNLDYVIQSQYSRGVNTDSY